MYLCPTFILRCDQWIINLNDPSLKHLSVAKLNEKRVCSLHFEDSAYSCAANRSTDSRLKCDAVPTINICLSSTLSNKRKAQPAQCVPLKKMSLEFELPILEEVVRSDSVIPQSSIVAHKDLEIDAALSLVKLGLAPITFHSPKVEVCSKSIQCHRQNAKRLQYFKLYAKNARLEKQIAALKAENGK
jgi:hypothetical protein